MAEQMKSEVVEIPENATASETTEVNLTDDVDVQPKSDFNSATLEVEVGGPSSEADDGIVDSRGVPPVDFRGPGLHRDRPYSASMISRKSTASVKSQTSLSPNIISTDVSVKSLFAYKVSEHCYC